MKKILPLLFITVLSMNLFAARVSRDEAATVAKNYYFQQYNLFNAEIKYDAVNFLDVIEEKRNGETLLYVFTLENGYVIVSADDAMTPVIGYSWESKYPVEKEAHFEWFINEYINNIEYLQDNAIEADFDIMNQWNMYLTDDYSSLLQTKDVKDVPVLISATWNQDWPYNYYAPEDEDSPANGHTYAGCVATAMSMIMYYWQYPDHGEGFRQYYQYPYGVLEANFEDTYYAWDAMLDNVSSNSNQEAIRAIAELQYQCGIAVHMNYGPDGSGAFSPDVPASLENYLRYEDAVYQQKGGMTNDQWDAILVEQLDNGYPMYQSGTEPPSYGHAFIIDGYNYSGSSYTFHFNFGWGGYGNGYFTSSNAGGYTDNHAIVKNFIPTEQYPNHATGLTTLSHKVGRFTDGSGPIENYIDNNTASWLIAPQTENDSIEKITLYFDEFLLDGSDVIRIYDGEDDSAPMLGEYTGNDTPSTLYSTGNKMYIVFETDDSGNAEGFVLRYSTSIHAWCSSTVTFDEPTGSFDDGSGDKNYAPGAMCRFKIVPEYASSVTLIFDSFETVNEDDYLEVYDYQTQQLLGSFSGTELPDAVTSESGKLYIVWRTDNFDEADGWSAHWETDNVGIANEEAFNEFNLYPNPASNEVSVKFETRDANNLSVQIIAADGKVMYNFTADTFNGVFNNTIDVSSYAKGIYFLRMNSNEGFATKKLVIE